MQRFNRFLVVVWISVIQLAAVASQNEPGYLGCFRIGRGGRFLFSQFDSDLTVERCLRFCLDNHYLYASLEHSWVCSCSSSGDALRRRAPDGDCSFACGGNGDQTCGGQYGERRTLYNISQAVCSNDIGPPSHGDHTITDPPSVSDNLRGYKFLGTRVEFQCDSGYTLHGASSIQCVDTGRNAVAWNDTLPTCQVATTTVATTTVATTTVATTTVATTTVATTTFATTTFATTTPTTTTAATTAAPTTTTVPTATAAVATEAPLVHQTTTEASEADNAEAAALSIGTSLGILAGLLTAAGLAVFIIILVRKRRQRRTKPGQTEGVSYANDVYGEVGASEPPSPPEDQHAYVVLDGPPADGDYVYANIGDAAGTGAAAGPWPAPEQHERAPCTPTWAADSACATSCPGTRAADTEADVQDSTEWVDNIIYE